DAPALDGGGDGGGGDDGGATDGLSLARLVPPSDAKTRMRLARAIVEAHVAANGPLYVAAANVGAAGDAARGGGAQRPPLCMPVSVAALATPYGEAPGALLFCEASQNLEHEIFSN